jgi:alkanesulfonate monooxygenase SsuD/methylene tetrahydromethanopterin reductase-like flavin-dependent oxidoreductase (luciferase family)
VTLLAHGDQPARLGGSVADLVYVTPFDATGATQFVDSVRSAQDDAGRGHETVHVFADVAVLLDDDAARAADRLAGLDTLAGAAYGGGDAYLFAGTAADLADLLLDWQGSGLTGFRLRPAALPYDLEQISRKLVPELQRRGAFRTAYEEDTLRERLRLPRPANRYAAAAADTHIA